jgi:septum site-determining protein MinC
MDQKSCFELKGSLFTLTILQLIHNDLTCLKKELAIKVEMVPNFFNNTPVVIDFHKLEQDPKLAEIDFKLLKEIICSYRMIPVGIKGSLASQKAAIEEAGLAILAEAKPVVNKKEPIIETKVITEIQTVKVTQKSLLVKQTVRSGQQINAPDGDLIIMGSVSAGAEVLAAGNIHIYGTLRGRALAGIKGDAEASIFCHDLQAELISITGIYLLCDDFPLQQTGHSTHICLQNEKLIFNSLVS